MLQATSNKLILFMAVAISILFSCNQGDKLKSFSNKENSRIAFKTENYNLGDMHNEVLDSFSTYDSLTNFEMYNITMNVFERYYDDVSPISFNTFDSIVVEVINENESYDIDSISNAFYNKGDISLEFRSNLLEIDSICNDTSYASRKSKLTDFDSCITLNSNLNNSEKFFLHQITSVAISSNDYWYNSIINTNHPYYDPDRPQPLFNLPDWVIADLIAAFAGGILTGALTGNNILALKVALGAGAIVSGFVATSQVIYDTSG